MPAVSLELRFVLVVAVMVLAVAITAAHDWLVARRAERQLESARWMRRGFRQAKRMGWLPEDTQ